MEREKGVKLNRSGAGVTTRGPPSIATEARSASSVAALSTRNPTTNPASSDRLPRTRRCICHIVLWTGGVGARLRPHYEEDGPWLEQEVDLIELS